MSEPTKTFADLCLERAEKATEIGQARLDEIVFKAIRPADTSFRYVFEIELRPDEIGELMLLAGRGLLVPELARRLNAATMRLKEAAQIIHNEKLMDDEEYQEELDYIATLEAPLGENKCQEKE